MVAAAAAAACVRTRWRHEAGPVAVGGVAVLDVQRRAAAGGLGEVTAAGAPAAVAAAAGVAAEGVDALQLQVELPASHGAGSLVSEGAAAAEVVKGTQTVLAPPQQTAEPAVLATSLAPRQQQQQSGSQR